MALGRQLASGLCLLVAAGALLGCGDGGSDATIPPEAAANLEQKLDRIEERANAGKCTGPDSAASSLESLREAMGTEPLSSIDESLAADLEKLIDRLAEQLARDCDPAVETDTTEPATTTPPLTTEPPETEETETTTTKTTTHTTTTRTTTTQAPPDNGNSGNGNSGNGGNNGNSGGGGNSGGPGGANGGVGPGRDRGAGSRGESGRHSGAAERRTAGFPGHESNRGRDR